MAVDEQEAPITAISSLCFRRFVEYLLKPGNTELVVRLAIRGGCKGGVVLS